MLGSLGISIASTALTAADLPFPFDLPDDGLLAAALAVAYGNSYHHHTYVYAHLYIQYVH